MSYDEDEVSAGPVFGGGADEDIADDDLLLDEPMELDLGLDEEDPDKDR